MKLCVLLLSIMKQIYEYKIFACLEIQALNLKISKTSIIYIHKIFPRVNVRGEHITENSLEKTQVLAVESSKLSFRQSKTRACSKICGKNLIEGFELFWAVFARFISS